MNVTGVCYPHEMMGFPRDSIEGIGISLALIKDYNEAVKSKHPVQKGSKGRKGGSGQHRARKISSGAQRGRMKNVPTTRNRK